MSTLMRKITPLALSLMLASVSMTAHSKTLFRYTNDAGVKVITDGISPEYAVKGYEVIDSQGQVIKVVPPELSEEEKTRLQKAVEEKRRLAKWDEELLSRYSTIEDIKATKTRRLTGIDNSIASLRLTLANISQTIKHYQAEAATSERQGEVASEKTLSSITRLQKDRLFFEEEIKRKEKKKQQVTDSYDRDIKRFKVIQPPPLTPYQATNSVEDEKSLP